MNISHLNFTSSPVSLEHLMPPDQFGFPITCMNLKLQISKNNTKLMIIESSASVTADSSTTGIVTEDTTVTEDFGATLQATITDHV